MVPELVGKESLPASLVHKPVMTIDEVIVGEGDLPQFPFQNTGKSVLCDRSFSLIVVNIPERASE